MSNWYNTGYDSAVDNRPSNGKKKMYRFYMPVGGETTITFVDDDTKPLTLDHEGKKVQVSLPVIFREYQLHLNNNWRNWFTAPQNPEDDVLAKRGERSSQVAAFTVIDHSEWKDKQGATHKDELKLFVVKTSSSTFKVLQKASAKRGGLRGCKFTVTRLADKSSNVGDTFEFEEKVELDAAMQPANYLEEFAPTPKDQILRLIGGGGSSDDSAVPF